MVRRRGISLMEVAAAGILLAVMLTVCVQFLRATARQRRGLQARRAAIQEAANVMERVCARPWEELTPEAAGQVRLSEEAQAAVAGGALQVDVAQTDEKPDGKRITVVLRWPGGPGQPDRSVRLVAWRYRVTAP
jgi:Tfp pilus assembly protein PilV